MGGTGLEPVTSCVSIKTPSLILHQIRLKVRFSGTVRGRQLKADWLETGLQDKC